MRIEFGVMSTRYELEAKNIDIGKLAMVLFFQQNIPIAIYLPNKSAFMPSDFLKEKKFERKDFESKEVRKSFLSIKDMNEKDRGRK